MTGARVLVKAECLQTAGSFKIRGAMHRVMQLPAPARAAGVVAFSSGNFGQGLAAACAALRPKVRCTIVMPGDAPRSKQDRARSYGAEVVLSEVIEGINREVTAAELAESLARSDGFTLLHPFEDLDVIAGQGSCAVEIAQQFREREMGVDGAALGGGSGGGVPPPDALIIPVGGGGLAAGCALAARDAFGERTRIFAVEPEGYDDHARSFAAGEILAVNGAPPTTCDSLQAVAPGKNTFPITSRLLAGGLVVSDEEVRHAMQVAFETLQIVLEPGGATALAAVLSRKLPFTIEGKTICLIASGGNLTMQKFAGIVGCKQQAKL